MMPRWAGAVARVVRAWRAGVLATAAVALCTACTQGDAKKTDLRQYTDDMAFWISTDPMPPHAREKTLYKVVVRDKKSGQPIDNGEGRVFATSRDGASTWDALLPGPEPGTYFGTLRFITAGDWAVAIQFRRDSTKKLDRMDWTQNVRAASDTP